MKAWGGRRPKSAAYIINQKAWTNPPMNLVAHPLTQTRTRERRLQRDGGKELEERERGRERDMIVDMIMGRDPPAGMLGLVGEAGGGMSVPMPMRRCPNTNRRMGVQVVVDMLGVVLGRRRRGSACGLSVR